MIKNRAFYFLTTLALMCSVISCRRSSNNIEQDPITSLVGKADSLYGYQSDNPFQYDLDSMLSRGYITAIVDNSSTGMFLYRGEPMGYEYELLSLFAKSLNVELRLEIIPSLEGSFKKLNSGLGDIMAYNLSVTKERKNFMDFTVAHNFVRQVLVQRKPANWRDMKLHEIEEALIRNPIDLEGKEIHVRKGSAFTTRLGHLSEEIGADILVIEEYGELETEALVEMVSVGSIEYTVADEDVALVNARYYPNIDVRTAISFPQQIAWGVRKNSPQLLDTLNHWIMAMKRTNEYYVLYDKYYKSTLKSKQRVQSSYFSTNSDRLSPYDSLIKIGAALVGWDWQLLAAQISKESRFDSNAESWVGAKGLMQLMPKTGREFGAKDLFNPEQNISAGVLHIQWLQNYWKDIPDQEERLKFVLASYNVGHGHVKDAISLTSKYGKDSTLWDNNVAEYLLLKSKKKYYNDPVVNFGYCRGNEPVEYVKDILYRYSRYLQLGRSE
jgi:membrane-bound lytic murein transglycosylase F